MIERASQLVKVFAYEDEGDTVVQKAVRLPRLEFITLDQLPRLVNFYPRNYHVLLPCLQKVKVQSCPNMTRSFAPTPDKTVHVNGEVPTILAVFIFYFTQL